MKKSHIILIIVGVILLFGIGGCVGVRNGIVGANNNVEEAWGNVQAAYQYRYDLIPNLASTVKGYAAHESSTLQNVTNARVGKVSAMNQDQNSAEEAAKACQAVQNDPNASLAQKQQAMNDFDRKFSIYVNAVHEAYPDLKANENFLSLQDEISGTESRIKKSREDYNKSVKEYNNKIEKFPGSIFAWGYSRKDMFQADAQASVAPKMEF